MGAGYAAPGGRNCSSNRLWLRGYWRTRQAACAFLAEAGKDRENSALCTLLPDDRLSVACVASDWLLRLDSCLWVAVLEGKVVGVVAAVGQQKSGGAVELKRMSVDWSSRQRGVGAALGRKVLEFAVTHRYSFVVLGTTAYTQAPHQLYQRLGFRCVGVTNGYVTPGANTSFLEQIFYRVRHHHYSLHVQNSKIASKGH
ncbi:N-acetylaspartate synthetase [Larimichthys crocea]|uniref:N-acetylaspartate synthetase n=1 Tax=Larimichthys crocea TaxID=215358 RepID=A0A6G0JBA0_LARCR|nr:N-acetylaspartate synthetase [Larimichthys crocea]